MKAVQRKSMFKVAIKRIPVPEQNGRSLALKYIVREIGILRRLSKHASNKYSVRLFDVVVPDGELKEGKLT